VLLVIVYLVIFIHMFLVWIWYRLRKNPSVVDVGWASGLTLSGFVYLLSQEWSSRHYFMGVILLVWGLRLGGYLWYTRIRHGIVDKRYTKLSEDWKIAKPLGFFLNFQLQGVFIFIISLPWYFAALAKTTVPGILDYIAFLLAVFAIFFESLADYQLHQFKKSHHGELCQSGLWNYSRHPNYFFEWLTWCAFTLFAFSSPYGWLALISPLTLYLIMTRITGPITEQSSIESKGEVYRHYQKSTPMFFPIKTRIK